MPFKVHQKVQDKRPVSSSVPRKMSSRLTLAALEQNDAQVGKEEEALWRNNA